MLVKALPIIIKLLAIVGTVALILVAGGIFLHNFEYIHHLFPDIPTIISEFILGSVGGLLAVAALAGVNDAALI